MNVQEYWDSIKETGCECIPYSLSSAPPPKCPIHCSCMRNGRVIPGSKKIDGSCRICGNYPFDYITAMKSLDSFWERTCS